MTHRRRKSPARRQFRAVIAAAVLCMCGVLSGHAATLKPLIEAAERGDVDAQYQLGVLYVGGTGTQRDYAQAVKWLTEASGQGHHDAQYMLGSLYDVGFGVDESDETAVRWYQRAAEQGHARAQRKLGIKLAEGNGAAQDRVAAYAWWTLAMAQGDGPATQRRALLSTRLTAAEREQGAALSRTLLREAAPAPRAAASANPPATAASRPAERARRKSAAPGRALNADRDLVEAIQRGLNQRGYNAGPADGLMGPKTAAAIRAFQADQSLPVTGVPAAGLRQRLSGKR